VTDRGPGFSDEALDHLFEPFFSTRDSAGLGLSVVHGIVAEHGGTIRGENREAGGRNEPGGARVVIDLPAAEPGGDERSPP
jgi:signal transduction histidine kinase